MEVLRRLAALKRDEAICPNCAHRAVDPLSAEGWCFYCTTRRESMLESKRRWWRENRGAERES